MDPQNQTPQEPQQPAPVQQAPADTTPTTSMESLAAPEAAPTDAAVVSSTSPAAAPVNTHFVMSIISFVVGGGLFAILAIIFSVMAKNALKVNNVPEAESKAKWAKILAIVGIVVGVLFTIMFIALMATGAFNLEADGSVSTY